MFMLTILSFPLRGVCPLSLERPFGEMILEVPCHRGQLDRYAEWTRLHMCTVNKMAFDFGCDSHLAMHSCALFLTFLLNYTAERALGRVRAASVGPCCLFMGETQFPHL